MNSLHQDGARCARRRSARSSRVSAAFFLQLDEDVFEAGLSLRWIVRPGCVAIGRERLFERRAIAAADMQRRAEEGDVLDARLPVQLLPPAARAFAFDDEGEEPGLRDDLGDRAARDDVAAD